MFIGRPRFTFRAIKKKINNTYTQISSRGLVNFTQDTADLDFVHHKKHGTNVQSPVIVLHGLLSSKNGWECVSEALNVATGREVINVDARNHGASPHRASNNYFDMAYDTVKLIKRLEMKNVVLLAHSMGGRTAMVLSLLYPELVSSLIAIDISPIAISQQLANNFPKVLEIINNIHFDGIHTEAEAIMYAKEKMRALGVTQKEMVDLLVNDVNVGLKADGNIGWRPNVEALRKYMPVMLKFPYIPGKMFTGPTMFIKAELSDFMRVEDLPGIRGYYPQAQLKLIKGVGHNIQDENPSALIKLTTDFLMKTA